MIIAEFSTGTYMVGGSKAKMAIITIGDWMSAFPSSGDTGQDRETIIALKKIYFVAKRNELPKYVNVVVQGNVTTDAEVIYMKGVGTA